MKKNFIITGFLIGCLTSGFSQNYISGTVSVWGVNTAGGSTIVAPGAFFNMHNRFFERADFINQGDSIAINADSVMLILSGNALQTISGRFNLSALRLSNEAGAVIDNTEPVTMLTILDSVSTGINTNNASINAGNGLMTLRSTPLKTARIADLTRNNTTSGNTIDGSVIAERYLQNKRAYRLLGPATTADSATGQSIKDAWQEGATAPRGQIVNPNPGYGTVITRPGNNPATATGYDDGLNYSRGYSMHLYTSNGLLTDAPNTDLTHFSAHAAYLVEVRGDRSVPPEVQTTTYQTPPTQTNLRSKGKLHNGQVKDTVTNSAGSFPGVANPYACTIDFSKLTLEGVVNGFYVWDPTIGTLGAWVYIDGTDNYNATPNAPGTGAYTDPATNSLIQSGQAILVKPIGSSGIITFEESSKEAANRADVFRQMPLPSLSINLYNEDSSNYYFTDGTTAVFDAAYSKAAIPSEDIYKPGNITENLSFYTNGSFLMKEKGPMPVANDTLQLQLWKTSVKKYRFVATAANMGAVAQAYLIDKYLKTSTPLAASASTNYDFDINTNAASKATDRFAIVFGASVLPVTFTQIKAYVQTDGINVQWNVQNESGIAYYEVEKALDGRTFTKIGTVAAKGGSNASLTYNLLDAQAAFGDNYYRVKSIDANGGYKYTGVVKATIVSGIMTVTAVPNPVKNNMLRLMFKNAPAGQYSLILYSNDGKKVMIKSIEHSGGAATYTYPVNTLAKGVYQLQVQGDATDKEKRNIPIIIE